MGSLLHWVWQDPYTSEPGLWKRGNWALVSDHGRVQARKQWFTIICLFDLFVSFFFTLFSWSFNFYPKLLKLWTVIWQDQRSPEMPLIWGFNHSSRVTKQVTTTTTSSTTTRWFGCWTEPGHVFSWRDVENIRTWDDNQHKKLYSELSQLSLWDLEEQCVESSSDRGTVWSQDFSRKQTPWEL